MTAPPETQCFLTSVASQAVADEILLPLTLQPDGVHLLDQTRLPAVVVMNIVTTAESMAEAIRTMKVRGAPALGIAGAFGIVLAAREACARGLQSAEFLSAVQNAALMLVATRPTAVNLHWAIDRMMGLFTPPHPEATPEVLLVRLEQEALAIQQEDLTMCHAIGAHGAGLIPTGGKVLTHCNAGALATAGHGTALGIVRSAFAHDPTLQVFASETRPRLQGAKLTVWELQQSGIPVTLITDNMIGWLMQSGQVDVVIVGADRVAANGDTANKIGTYTLALAAKAHDIPFYVACPSSTIDATLTTGAGIPIELRDEDEVTRVDETWLCPEGTRCLNPAFDVTPAAYITGIVTERGVFHPPYHF